jgi:pimeloyl-ACP methyl ester carboxylesterase
MSARTHVEFEPIVGRYMHLDLSGRAHRLYVEEAGEGTPLLCLHTAGSDGRQYRGLMNDPRITRNHRVIAFDMPWHGKSSPPRQAGTTRNINSPRRNTPR